MAFEISPVRLRHNHLRDTVTGRDIDGESAESAIVALRAENAELRKVVVELSRLVIRNVLRESRT